MVDIVEIGAGGGSIAWFDAGGALRVGPLSAGADPGPACYGRGGTEPTVTDALLITGVLDPDYFLGGQLAVDVGSGAAGVRTRRRSGSASRSRTAAAGVIRVVNEQTIDALKLISVRRGYDPRDFTLVAFGGGGPTHAAALLAELGVRRIVIPPFPGTFSAWGMLLTEPRVDRIRTRVLPAGARPAARRSNGSSRNRRQRRVAALTAQGFAAEGTRGSPARSRHALSRAGAHGRGAGSSGGPSIAKRSTALFHERHRQQYTFALEDTPVEIVNFRVTATAPISRPCAGKDRTRANPAIHEKACAPSASRITGHGSGFAVRETPIFDRDRLPRGFAVDGPAIVEEPSTTTVVHPGQRLTVDDAET